MRGTDASITRTAHATAMVVSVGLSGSARSGDTKSSREENMASTKKSTFIDKVQLIYSGIGFLWGQIQLAQPS